MTISTADLEGLVLSAEELKTMNPEWADRMIQDYLTLITNTIAVVVDINESGNEIANTFASISANTAGVGKLRSMLSDLRLEVKKVEQRTVNSVSTGKLKSMITDLEVRAVNQFPITGLMVRFTGNAAANPTVGANYNVDTVTRQALGVYRITLAQETFFGIPVLSIGMFALSFVIDDDTSSDSHQVAFNTVSASEIDIQVFQIVQGAGNRLDVVPYDILAGDLISVMFLITTGTEELPPE